MNARNNNQGLGRLTGRVDVDAGLMRYQQLLSSNSHALHTRRSLRSRRLSSLLPVVGSRIRRAAAAITAATLLVLLVSLGTSAGVATSGAELFTLGEAGGSMILIGTASFTSPAILADVLPEDSGSVEILAAGKIPPYCVRCYGGEHCCGPAMLTP
jgi:hypothetical protein